MRTGDRPADHKPPPGDPPVPPVGKLLPRISSAGGGPGLSLSLTVTPGLRYTARPRPPHTHSPVFSWLQSSLSLFLLCESSPCRPNISIFFSF